MNTKLQTFHLDDGSPILVEVHKITDGRKTKDVAGLEDTKGTFEKAWSELEPAMSKIVGQLQKLGPDKVEVRFGVKLTASFKAVLAGTSAEANFEILLGWSKTK